MKLARLFPAWTLAVFFGGPCSLWAERSPEFSAEDHAWWAFQPLQEPALPPVRDTAWPRNGVDHFIAAGLQEHGLSPSTEAARGTLVRRIYFTLLGLPPTPEEVEAYVSDPGPLAWDNLVDRLLQSPRYGERQARLWLDLVRYADSDGYRGDHFRPDAWRYRDYVIASMNADKPYDRFLSEQLAGDELYPDDPAALVATGYLRHWIYEWNNRDVAGQRETILNDITDTTADVFLGVGLQCARCHDHKFDPLLQKDYYRLQAVFSGLDFPDSLPAAPAETVRAHARQKQEWEAATQTIRNQIEALKLDAREEGLQKAEALFPPETIAILHKPEPDRTTYEQQIATLTLRQVETEAANLAPKIKGSAKARLVDLQKELAQYDSLLPPPLPGAMAARDAGPQAAPVSIPRQEKEGDILPGPPTILSGEPFPVHPTPSSSGRRTALARWLSNPQNPLTARVLVNRIWQQHFGIGLSATPSDFGTLGEKPSHPELLDWLTGEFIRSGWSLKHLHRLILTSATWRQGHSPATAGPAATVDPGNRLLWRWTTRRLDAEQIRDALYFATGELDPAIGGPGVDSSQPRRSIYTKILRNARDPLLDVFDAPQAFQSTPTRDSTTTPTQSLFLANSRFMNERAEAMAQSLSELGDSRAQVNAAWQRAASRLPTSTELDESLEFLRQRTDSAPAPEAVAYPLESMPQRSGKAVVLAPGTSLEHLRGEVPALPAGGFTIEGVALLRSVFSNGSVRTLAGQPAADGAQPAWSFGVTGMQSRRKPQTPVLLIQGTNAGGKPVQEALFSDHPLQLGRSYYLGVSLQPASADGPGTAIFYVKDLANDDEPLLTTHVPHPVTQFPPLPAFLYLGSADGGVQSLWDGLIDEVRITRGCLQEHELALRHPERLPDRTLAWWQFEPDSFLTDTVSGRPGILLPPSPARPDPAVLALTDLCHALLGSSAFLYLE